MTMSFRVPPGHRFVPTDEELVGYYLYNKVTGIAFPEGVIAECDLYGPHNPWDIWHHYHDRVVKTTAGEDLYLFTRLKRKTLGAKHVERRVGVGAWEGEAAPKKIHMMFLGTRQCVGFMKRFRFEKSQTHHDGSWIMHEYSLNYESFLPPSFQLPMEEYVICRIRKNKRMMKETENEMLSMQMNIDSEHLDSALASALINIEARLNEPDDILCADHQTQFEMENRNDNILYWKKVLDTFVILDD